MLACRSVCPANHSVSRCCPKTTTSGTSARITGIQVRILAAGMARVVSRTTPITVHVTNTTIAISSSASRA